MDPNSKEFKKLQKIWYKKLEKKGFTDVEYEDGSLKAWHSRRFQYEYDHESFRAKEEYYRMASKFLTDYHFESTTDRFIWSQHAEGVSIRDIVKMLKVKGTKAYKFGVHQTITKLRRLMFIGVGSDDDSREE